MLPVPTIDELSDFSGRPADSYGPFATSALRQATLLFSMLTRLTEWPTDTDHAELALMAIVQMADRLYLEQPNAQMKAGPFQSETIGSYSYSKAQQIAVTASNNGSKTGLYWWDLALELLAQPIGADMSSDVIRLHDNDVRIDIETGGRYIPSPTELVGSDYHRPDQPF